MFEPQVKDIGRGERIRADWLNEIVESLLQSIVGGEGVYVQRVGGRIVISQTASQIVPKT